MSDLYSDGKWDDFDKSMREEFDRWLSTPSGNPQRYGLGGNRHYPMYISRQIRWNKDAQTPGVRCADFDGACKDVQHMNCWVEHAKTLTEDSKELDGYCPYLLGQEPK